MGEGKVSQTRKNETFRLLKKKGLSEISGKTVHPATRIKILRDSTSPLTDEEDHEYTEYSEDTKHPMSDLEGDDDSTAATTWDTYTPRRYGGTTEGE